MKLLEIKNLEIQFPSRKSTLTAVDNVSLSVDRGDILGIVGESGAGKSTVGNALIGLLEPPGIMTNGEIYLEDQRIDDLPESEKQKIRGKKIGMIFQDPLTSLNPLQTIETQLVETIDLHLQLGEEKAKQRARELLGQVGIPDPEIRVKQYPHQFSGGMRQRVVVALALCAEPTLIIADEPTTALDVSIQAQILDLMRVLCKQKNVGMIIITHDMGVIADITDRVAVMYHGNLVEHGHTAKILGDPDHPYTQSLISAVPRPDVKLVRFPQVTYIEDIETKKEDIDISSHWLGQGQNFKSADGPLIKLNNITMRFTTKPAILKKNRIYLDAVKNVSLDIKEGEVFGLVGESGSGKSTLARIICGLYSPILGEVIFSDTNLTALKRQEELDPFRRQMQMIFQDPYASLNPRMTVFDILAEPLLLHGTVEKRDLARSVKRLMEDVGLKWAFAKKYPHEFSGGQRQRVAIGRALATKPEFIVADEPVSALDVTIQSQILDLLKALKDEHNLTMLFVSHDLAVVRQIADRVVVLYQGKIVEKGVTHEVFDQPKEKLSYLLDSKTGESET